MNFLAHQFLSGNDEKIRIGNFIADFIKGKKHEDFEKQVRIGILYHREIDWFTDNHQVVRDTNEVLRNDFGKYAGVALDVYFDHFLAKNWDRYSDTNLREYTLQTYEIITDYKEHLPDRTLHMLKYMKRDNWLYHYKFTEGVGRSLRGISSRTKFESGLEKGEEVLIRNYDLIENAEFNS